MRSYDTQLFIEIIESIDGIRFLREAMKDSVIIRFYQGRPGKLVMLDCSEDYIPDQTAIDYLEQLGLTHLMESLFPNEPIVDPASVPDPILVNNPTPPPSESSGLGQA